MNIGQSVITLPTVKGEDKMKCVRCGSDKVVGETITGRPACYYHEDKLSYLERMEAEKAAKDEDR